MSSFTFDPAKLDFNTIKSKLKTYFAESGEFADYDFEGSGLSSLLDVLAYNTHLQAMVANMATNEAFIDTAQLRSSVVSHAKPLNYLPRSRRSAKATLKISLQNVPNGTADLVIPKYTKFTTNIDNKAYTFYTLDDYTATAASSYVVDIDVYEGKKLNKRFIVDDDTADYPIYVVPDKNMDTSTITVNVREGLNAIASEAYTIPASVGSLTATDKNYFLFESPNGYYEIMLGDGSIGKKPSEGSVIDVVYLKSSAVEGNNAKTFATSETVDGYAMGIALVTKSYGGTERESIESIKFNAPKAFAAQDRAVTVADYKTFIQQEAGYIETLNVWGGEDNYPPEYGRVFIAIKPVGADAITATQETQLRENTLKSRNIITIEPQFVDPEFQYLEVKMNVRYEPSGTTLTKSQLENKVKDTILEYGTTNLAAFESVFRKSRLLTYVDDSDDSVVSASADVWAQRRLVPTLNVKTRYELAFTLGFGSVTQYDRVVVSDSFSYLDGNTAYTCTLRNKTNSTQLEIVRAGASGAIVVVDNAGYIDTTNNLLVLTAFSPSGIPNGADGIRFSARPADDNTVYPKRNLLIRIDDLNTSVNADVDVALTNG